MTAVDTTWGVATATGRRTGNEDAYLAVAPVFLVADGMGGHDSGEVASALVVDQFADLGGRPDVEPQDLLERIRRSAAQIRALPEGSGRDAGTTVAGVAIGVRDDIPYWLVFNIGDSRVYRVTDGVLEQVTVDHSEVQEQLDAGVISPRDVARHPRRHVVTRAVGAFATTEPEFWMLPVGAHDRMLVCSDGLTGELDDVTIARILLDRPEPQSAADGLVQAALACGGRDNVTVVVVDVVGPQDDETVPSLVDDEVTLTPDELQQMVRPK